MDYINELVLSDGIIHFTRPWISDTRGEEIRWKEKRELKKRIKSFLKENVTAGKRVTWIPYPLTKDLKISEFWSWSGWFKNLKKLASIECSDYGAKYKHYITFYKSVNGKYVPDKEKTERFLDYMQSKCSTSPK